MGGGDLWGVVHSGVELDPSLLHNRPALRERLRKKLGIPTEALVAGTVCRLEPIKGARYLGYAADTILKEKENRALYFLFVGEGEERPILEEVRGKLSDPDRMVLAGHRADALACMAAMDVYIQPSLNEGMGKTLIMAQAMGLPVVASRVCGIPDVVRENETGLLVPPADVPALVAAVQRLCSDKELREAMGRAGPMWVAESVEGYPRFSVQRMIHLLELIYDGLEMEG